jgi:hypothetical protein
MKAKLYNIGPVVVTQLLSEERNGDCIVWLGRLGVVNVLSSDDAKKQRINPEQAIGGEVFEIEVPDSLVQRMETDCTYSEGLTAALWLGFLLGRGYIDSIPL